LRHKKPENYLAAFENQTSGISEARQLSRAQQASEALLMGLRLTEGIDLSVLETRFGIPASSLIDHQKLALHKDLGFVEQDEARLKVTEKGMLLLDGLLGDLVPAELALA
jgi:oxygen-independent coproporphyrinogen-3 oxidase